MFANFFRGRASSAVALPEALKKNENDSDDGSADSEDGEQSIEFHVEAGSGKGWPENATVLLYHRTQGLICVGTEGGSIYVFGDGFQYVRPWLTADPNEVVSLVALYPNKVLAAFADNSIVVMELPSLSIVDMLQPSWLGPKGGDITALHSDLIGEKPFVFIGTSEGNVHVFDVMETSVRFCDPILTVSDFGLQGQGVSVADIHLCPKDERYLAVGFDGADLSSGAVVVLDLVKHKVHKSFKTPAITSLTWHHQGEVLFAGTMTGELLAINVEKGAQNAVWNSSEEVINEEEEDNAVVGIRRISWLGPQGPTQEGCLFLLLSSSGLDNDNLKNVVVGLTPSNVGSAHIDMQPVFALPPVHCEKVLNYRTAPTYTRNQDNITTSTVTPALLLLTQHQDYNNRDLKERKLRIIRCPTTPMSEWGLEIGTMPDPRMATEVLPAQSTVTVLHGLLPDLDNPLSLSKCLLEMATSQEGVVQTTLIRAPSADTISSDTAAESHNLRENAHASRRLSARAFYANYIDDLEKNIAHDDWEMVLACGQHEEAREGQGTRQQDVVFAGHADGTVIAFGASLPAGTAEVGRGTIFLPLTAIRCGTTSISSIASDDVCGVLGVGDEEGYFSLFTLFDEDSDLTAIDVINQVGLRMKSEAEILATDSKLSSLKDFPHTQLQKQFMMFDEKRFGQLQQVYRTKLPSKVTSILVVAALQRVYVGLENGAVYCSTDLRSSLLAPLTAGPADPTDTPGAVVSILHGYLPVGVNLIACVYIYHQSGRLTVVDIMNNLFLYVQPTLKVLGTMADEPVEDQQRVAAATVLHADHSLMPRPSPEAVLYANARMQRAAAEVPEAPSSVATEAPPPPAEEPKRRSFFSRGVTPKPSSAPAMNTSPVAAPPSELGQFTKAIRYIDYDLAQVPSKLALVHGRHMVTFDVKKIGEAVCAGGSVFNAAGKKRDSLANVVDSAQAVSVKAISARSIVCAQSMLFGDADHDVALDDPHSWKHYFACVDQFGSMHLFNPATRKALAEANLLEGMSDSARIQAGYVLPNGSAYLLHKGNMVFSAAFHHEESVIPFAVPARASPHSNAIDPSLHLPHGREALLAQTKAAVKKRRSSVITITAGPTDLYKIFSKTREQKAKDTLFAKDSAAAQEEDSGVRKATRGVNKLSMSEMQELRQNLEERGEKINRITLKMEDFKQSAADFRATARAQKEKLANTNSRWGLF